VWALRSRLISKVDFRRSKRSIATTRLESTMNKTFSRTLTLAVIAAPLLAFANDGEMFRNGSSFYGEPANGAAVSRTVDAGTTRALTVEYGETVKFVKGSEQFTWTFNGLDGRDVELAKIAPHSFAGTQVRVGRNPLSRN
jgi:hypothetical protein